MKINIKCLVPIKDNKIAIIKAVRAAFDIGLKEAKDLVDGFNNKEIITYEEKKNFSIKQLNDECSKDRVGVRLIEFSAHGERTTNGFCTEDFLEKIKFFAGLALENNKPVIAEDLLHVYNKHTNH